MIRVALGFVLGAAAAVLGEHVARSILVHAELAATELLGVETYDHLR